MNAFTCPICGGKLNIKIGAEFAPCSSCGNLSRIDRADAEKFKEIYGRAQRAMMKKTEAGYREAMKELDVLSFTDEAAELSRTCESRLKELEDEKRKRSEFEKASEKRNTVLGVILVAVTLLFCLAALAGIVYTVVRLVNGSLSPWALWITAGVAVLAVILIVINKLK